MSKMRKASIGRIASQLNSSKNDESIKIKRMKQFDEYFKKLEEMKIEFFNIYENGYKYQSKNIKSPSDFELIRILGKGSFSTVVLAKLKANNVYYAMKIINKKQACQKNQYDHLQNEKLMLNSINFPFLLNMDFSFEDIYNIYFVMPYIPGGDLFELMSKHRPLREKDAKFYAAQVVLALEYLHYMNIIHRDLKPENIILDIQGYIKLTDYGFCKLVETRTYTLCGTPEYLAPEIIVSKGYGISADWWSLGILLYEMLVGYTPFYDTDRLKIFEKITSGKYKFPTDISSDARDLICNILQIDLNKRYGTLKNGVLDIKIHDWFKYLDWNAIYNKTVVAPHIPKVNSAKKDFTLEQFFVSTLVESRNE